jgi:hypothetical protein
MITIDESSYYEVDLTNNPTATISYDENGNWNSVPKTSISSGSSVSSASVTSAGHSASSVTTAKSTITQKAV